MMFGTTDREFRLGPILQLLTKTSTPCFLCKVGLEPISEQDAKVRNRQPSPMGETMSSTPFS